jgi:O-antigen ligase
VKPRPLSLFDITFCALLIGLLFSSWLPQRIYLSIFQCGLFVLSACWLRQTIRRNIALTVPLTIAIILITPCIGLGQLAAGTAVYPWKTAVATLDWAALASAGWLAGQLSENNGFTVVFRRFLVVTGAVVAILGTVHWYTSPGLIFWTWPNPYQMRVTFPILNHSHFAAFLELALAPAVWMAMKSPRTDLLHTWAAAVMICAVWMTGSRSGSVIILLELAGVIVLGARCLPGKTFPWRRTVLLAGPIIILVVGIGWQGIAARFAEPARDDLRSIFSRAALGMIHDRPVTGFGLGSFSVVYPAYESADVGLYVEHAHNDWLEWGTEGGLLLPILMLGLAFLSLRKSFALPWNLGVVAVFIQALVEFPLHNSAAASWQFAAIGCAAGCTLPKFDAAVLDRKA